MAARFGILAAIAASGVVQQVHAWSPDLPICLEPFRPFVYTGCFGDPDGTTLDFRSTLDQNNMTIELCQAECKGNGYRYAGIEYYGICWCGATVSGPELDSSECTFPCTGNSSEVCGGDSKMSLYEDTTFEPVDDTTIADYVPLGCWTDDSDQGKALVYQQNLNTSTMTTEICLQACKDEGFPFGGTEYGQECYCGVVIGNGTASAPATDCNMPCNGNAGEICGGPARLSLYVAKDLESLEPCGYVPPSSSSTTSTVSSTTSTSSSSSSITSTTSTTCTTTTTPSTTSKPTSTTKSTTSSTSLCTATTTIPSTCEYGCGSWCNKNLPEWTDSSSCSVSYAQCKLQINSCFSKAGWPGASSCFNYASWCESISSYCSSSCKGTGCSKTDCFSKNPPKGGTPCSTSTSSYTCKTTMTTTAKTTSTTSTKTSTTTSCAVPSATGICKQPTNVIWGYAPGKPVGGVDLPVLTCNNLLSDYNAGNPFKLYTDSDSSKCKGYGKGSVPSACYDACQTQYTNCVNVYAQSCKTKRSDDTLEARSDSYSTAMAKCSAQLTDCILQNLLVSAGSKCGSYNSGW